MDLKELDLIDPNTHWYYQAKLAGIRAALPFIPHEASILDIGAGSGFFSMALAQEVEGASVTCVDTGYSTEELGVRESARFLNSLSACSQDWADLTLLIDVLEHVVDDHGLLAEAVARTKPSGFVVISVPAFMSLWSAHDVFLEHVRRYRLGEVIDLVEESGLTVLDARYLFGSITPAAWVVRRLRRSRQAESDLRPAPAAVNTLLKSALSWENAHLRNRIAGLSAFVMAQR